MGWPSFLSWRQGGHIQGAEVATVPLASDGAYDLEAVLAAVTPRTKLVVVVSPNNPTGQAVAPGDLAAFLDALPEHVLPALDEAYFEYLAPGGHDGLALVRQGRRLAVFRTFSKIYGLAGLRVGWMAAPADLVAALGRVRNAFDVNGPAQAAAVASLAAADLRLPARVAANASGRERLAQGLRELGLEPLPSAANFLLVELGAERARPAYQALLDRGVIVRPARAFGAPGALRVTVGWPEENRVLLDALGEVLDGLPEALAARA
jgi:histidinol-phosphate aminotransferase